jgi:hypothetical protein
MLVTMACSAWKGGMTVPQLPKHRLVQSLESYLIRRLLARKCHSVLQCLLRMILGDRTLAPQKMGFPYKKVLVIGATSGMCVNWLNLMSPHALQKKVAEL